MALSLTTAARRLPSKLRLKGWKPNQDLRYVRQYAFKLAREFKLRDGDCAVVTNKLWRTPSQRKFCLIVQTGTVPMVCYLPTDVTKVRILKNITLELHEFLNLIYKSLSA